MERSINLLIDYQCPQCGAPATLQETDRIFTCGFCRVKSYLLPQGYFRCVFPHNAPAGKEIVYFPYWRFKGMSFACVASGVKDRFFDVSHQAIPSRFFPLSVGFRSQTLKLKFVSPETEGRFLKPLLELAEVKEIVDERFRVTLPKPILHQSFIGDTCRMLYAPFYAERQVYDAVLNQPISLSRPEDFDVDVSAGEPADWGMDFLPTLCPSCGWDLEGEGDTLVLICKNCSSAWHPGNKNLDKLSVAHVPGDGEKVVYMPFWRIEADVTGIQLDSYADLVKAANLPKAVQPSMYSMPFYFWSPAFKVRPQDYLRLSTSVTVSQSCEEPVPELPPARTIPVNMPLEEALETLKLNLANFLKPRQHLGKVLPEVGIVPGNRRLIYLPFNEGPHEYLHPRMHLSINRNLLAMARYL